MRDFFKQTFANALGTLIGGAVIGAGGLMAALSIGMNWQLAAAGFVIVFGVLIVLAPFSGLLVARMRQAVYGLPRNPNTEVNTALPSDVQWLEVIANDDKGALQSRVHARVVSWEFQHASQESEPAVSMSVHVINASVYNVRPKTIAGHLTVNKRECKQAIQLLDSSIIGHGNHTYVRLLQPIDGDTWLRIRERTEEKKPIEVNVGSLRLGLVPIGEGLRDEVFEIGIGHMYYPLESQPYETR